MLDKVRDSFQLGARISEIQSGNTQQVIATARSVRCLYKSGKESPSDVLRGSERVFICIQNGNFELPCASYRGGFTSKGGLASPCLNLQAPTPYNAGIPAYQLQFTSLNLLLQHWWPPRVFVWI